MFRWMVNLREEDRQEWRSKVRAAVYIYIHLHTYIYVYVYIYI